MRSRSGISVTLDSGESATIQINADVAEGLIDGTVVTIPVQIMTSSFSSSTTVERTVSVIGSRPMQVALGVDGDPLKPGELLSYVVDIGNSDTEASQALEYVLRLPPDVTYESASGGGTFDAASGEVTWTFAGLEAGARVQRVVEVTVPPSLADGTLLRARGELRAGAQAEPRSVQERTVLVDAAAPLAVGIDAVGDPVVSGGVVALEYRVSNLGADPLTSVTVVFPVPAGLGLDYTGSAEPDAATQCRAGPTDRYCDPGEEARWNLATLDPGESATIQVNVDIAEGLADGTLLTVPVRVNASSGVTATAERTLAVSVRSPLQAALGVDRDPAVPGELLSYVVDVGNSDAVASEALEYVLRLPDDVTYESSSGGGTFDAASGEVTWSFASLQAGARVQRVVEVTVPPSLADGTLLRARGELRAGAQAEPRSVQERAVLVDAEGPLAVGIDAVGDPVVSGGVVALEYRVSNIGAEPLTSVTVVFPVPDGLGFDHSGSAEPDASSQCRGAPTDFYCDPGEEARWSLGTLDPGESATIQVNVDIAEGLADGTLLTVPVRVSASSGVTATAERTLAVSERSPLQAALGANPDLLEPGASLSYVVDIGNSDAVASEALEYVLRLPAGGDVRTSSGGGTFDAASREVTWALATSGSGRAGAAGGGGDGVGGGGRRCVVARAWRAAGGLGVGAAQRAGAHGVGGCGRPVGGGDQRGAGPGGLGGVVALEYRVSNLGAAPLNNVSVVFPVPDGLGFDYAGRRGAGLGESVPRGGDGLLLRSGRGGALESGHAGCGCERDDPGERGRRRGTADGTLLTVPVRVSATSGVTATAERTVAVSGVQPLQAGVGRGGIRIRWRRAAC